MSRGKITISTIFIFCLIVSCFGLASVAAEDASLYINDEQGNQWIGLQPMTEEEIIHSNEILVESKDVYINNIALDRINAQREKDGQNELMLEVASLGDETISLNDVQTYDTSPNNTSSVIPLLKKVDNTTDELTAKYFPKAGNQGSQGSCGAFSSTYYQMTYMNALAKNYNVRDNDNYILSPRFTYNIGRSTDSISNGIWPFTAYEIAMKHGCPFNCDFEYTPYPSSPTDYLAWPTEGEIWRSALYNKAKECGRGYVGNAGELTPVENETDESLNLIKTYLANGYVLNIVTDKSHWKTVNVPDKGKVCIEVRGKTTSTHAMTVVGYDDELYYDINNNGVEDPGEFGAFKIINSWGESEYETWFMYDALNTVSAVTGIPDETGLRQSGWVNNREFTWVTMYSEYTPKLTAEFKVRTNDRSNIYAYLGVGIINSTTPSKTTTFKILNGNGNSYSIDGTKNNNEATIVLDYTDLINDNNLDADDSIKRWFISTGNSTKVEISEFVLQDVPFDIVYNTDEVLNASNHNIGINASIPIKVNKNKIWNLSFNYPLDINTINNQNIYIKDKYGEIFCTEIEMKNDNEFYLKWEAPYHSGQYYTLTINNVKTQGGNSLDNIYEKRFLIEIGDV